MKWRWLEKIRRNRDVSRRIDGYDYAAGRLLRRDCTAEELKAMSLYFRDEFDEGMMDAIADWESRGCKE